MVGAANLGESQIYIGQLLGFWWTLQITQNLIILWPVTMTFYSHTFTCKMNCMQVKTVTVTFLPLSVQVAVTAMRELPLITYHILRWETRVWENKNITTILIFSWNIPGKATYQWASQEWTEWHFGLVVLTDSHLESIEVMILCCSVHSPAQQGLLVCYTGSLPCSWELLR